VIPIVRVRDNDRYALEIPPARRGMQPIAEFRKASFDCSRADLLAARSFAASGFARAERPIPIVANAAVTRPNVSSVFLLLIRGRLLLAMFSSCLV
jgi:hypothetical protein